MSGWRIALSLSAAVASTVLSSAAFAKPGTADVDVTGHYYLSGVREVGSELLLKPDGQFQFYMSYGAVDLEANGRWERQGEQVILTAVAAPKAPLFSSDGKVRPWHEQAEQALLDAEANAAQDALFARCPFLHNGGLVSAPPPSVPRLGSKAPPPPTISDVRAAEAKEAASRAAYERVAGPAAGQGTETTQTTAARAARQQWEDDARALRHLRDALHIHDATSPEPVLPATCIEKPTRRASDFDPATWQRGFAVSVFDHKRRLSMNRLDVTVRFAGGAEARLQSVGGGGYAIRPQLVPATGDYAPVTQVRVALPTETREAGAAAKLPEILIIPIRPPVVSGMIEVTVDTDQLVPPAFDTLALDIVDGTLILPDGRGAYIR